MKKTHYFCNLCGEEVQEHDTIKITVHLEEVTTETGLRPNATRLSGHLHRNCVKHDIGHTSETRICTRYAKI